MRSKIHCVIPHVSPTGANKLLQIATQHLLHFPLPRAQLIHTHLPSRLPLRSSFSTSTTMSSDDAYMAFLNKANADSSDGQAQTSQESSDVLRTKTVDSSLSVPKPLKNIDAYYVSDTDEPFDPVVLKWDAAKDDTWPSIAELATLISESKDLSRSIESLPLTSFDPKDQYPEVFGAVRAAAAEKNPDATEEAVELKVYRIEITTTRIEYWILALHAPEKKIVGLRAKAVES
ncbi:uncharacterized protein N7511_007613 [Penicillium nucicola]|uniref:uncharacterized protein n=1 Tax=Penicillium nucicola TaxID=1850975 RepID=UPI002545A988|nr:uncharacterized protein N7511_007613 [Penicillium nucicola]KAJ5753460.1 hypothetical protein N7511_007613 [Penicillium nucicola]